MPIITMRPEPACLFCGKGQIEVKKLIVGSGHPQGDIYLCDECIKLCWELIQEGEGGS